MKLSSCLIICPLRSLGEVDVKFYELRTCVRFNVNDQFLFLQK
jgi:hypothetical protein